MKKLLLILLMSLAQNALALSVDGQQHFTPNTLTNWNLTSCLWGNYTLALNNSIPDPYDVSSQNAIIYSANPYNNCPITLTYTDPNPTGTQNYIKIDVYTAGIGRQFYLSATDGTNIAVAAAGSQNILPVCNSGPASQTATDANTWETAFVNTTFLAAIQSVTLVVIDNGTIASNNNFVLIDNLRGDSQVACLANTVTNTPTPTMTMTNTVTMTPTVTNTNTNTQTPTQTFTPTFTFTPTPYFTPIFITNQTPVVVTPPPGVKGAFVDCVGGGGGGAGVTCSNSTANGGGAGSGATYGWGFFPIATIGNSITVTIGAGGNGGTAGQNAGSNGGTTYFGALASVPGGNGGAVGTATSATAIYGAGGASPGNGTGFQLYVAGQPGTYSSLPISASLTAGSQGGNSEWGYGGITGWVQSPNSVAGAAGNLYGSGGGGAAANGSNSSSAGGAGKQGALRINWVY